MRAWRPCAYIVASGQHGTLYVGVTSELARRIWQHREGVADGFTKRYGIHRLVYFEMHATMEAAITREKQIREWRRDWKIRLIEEGNPNWADLYDLVLE